MEIGDLVESELDQAYKRYSEFIFQHYGWQPAPLATWIRVSRGVSNRSRAGMGLRLLSGPEHKRRQRARAALAALSGE